MKPQSAKAKGRNGQQEVRKLLLEAAPHLEEGDIRSTSMGAPGEDLLLSPLAKKTYPWNIEVKRRKSFQILRYMEQTQARTVKGETPVLVVREDRGDWMIMMPLEEFLKTCVH